MTDLFTHAGARGKTRRLRDGNSVQDGSPRSILTLRAGTCRICGCTEDRACDGGCWWVTPDLCSSCRASLYVSLWLDHPRAGGAGRRHFLLLGVKRKWVTLFYIPKLRAFRITRTEYVDGRPEPVDFRPRALAGQIRQAQRSLSHRGGKATRAALDLLRDAKREAA